MRGCIFQPNPRTVGDRVVNGLKAYNNSIKGLNLTPLDQNAQLGSGFCLVLIAVADQHRGDNGNKTIQ
ncbi:hypothetical protein AM228_13385 [Planktothricoides sp. SR001]|nr:hypothetical protein AM228_13385 [Planktothricoides sp. SR001]